MKRFIFITTKFEGLHKYPDAPEEVSYLKNLHRHIFHVKVWIEVFHNNRDIEFIMFKHEVESIIKEKRLDQHASCEMISDVIYASLKMNYDREIRIEVSEDGENGSYTEYDN